MTAECLVAPVGRKHEHERYPLSVYVRSQKYLKPAAPPAPNRGLEVRRRAESACEGEYLLQLGRAPDEHRLEAQVLRNQASPPQLRHHSRRLAPGRLAAAALGAIGFAGSIALGSVIRIVAEASGVAIGMALLGYGARLARSCQSRS